MDSALIPAWGAIVALTLSIVLIIKKVQPVYALIFGAFFGGFVSCFDLELVIKEMSAGAKDIVPAIIRILMAGVLAGTLVGTKSAEKIARSITQSFGSKKAVYAIVLASFVLTFSGVFIDVAVLTVAPIALAIAGKSGASKTAILVALVGGGKAGNVISPNPNTIAVASNFNAQLSSVMYANIGSAIIGLIVTILVVWYVVKKTKNETISIDELETTSTEELPPFWASVSGPIVAISLLVLRPIIGISIDPLIALPIGGFACALFTGKIKNFLADSTFGLSKMTPVAVLLLGTGCLGGIIKASTLKNALLDFMAHLGLSDIFIAPFSGALMSGASASTTAGAAIASATFAEAVLAGGISAVWGAAMTNAGAVALDQMPHGSFFHVSGGAVNMNFNERLKIVHYETIIGLAIAIVSTASCAIFS